MSARLELTGRRFGRLTVIQFSHVANRHLTHWICLCDCGAERIVRGTALTSGNTTGCAACQAVRAKGNRHAVKHQHTKTRYASPTYQSWKAMMARCYNSHNASWKYYGGRGIVVCDRWHDFRNFLADMGERPTGTTLDRINLHGHYEPTNCRWATPQEQRANQR
jgi:hypothetical protein